MLRTVILAAALALAAGGGTAWAQRGMGESEEIGRASCRERVYTKV